jgi:aminotransferase
MTHPKTAARAVFLAQRPRNRMFTLAARYTDVIGLGRGDPDLPTPPHIVEAAHRAARDGQTHYTPTLGIAPLREALSAKLAGENGMQYSVEEILITTGGQEAVNLIMQALLDPGDEVIIPNPSYGTYALAAHLAGGVPVLVPLDRDAGFQFDRAALEHRITPRTKAIAVVSPNNPTGTVQTRASLEGVADIARRHNLLVISDEIYEKILFDGAVHHSIGAFDAMRDRTIIVNGVSKAYSMTGWRVGWIAAPRPLMVGMQAVKDTWAICTPAPNQWAALAAVSGPQECLAETLAIYTRRRQWLMDGLRAAGLGWAPHGGSMFFFVDVSASGLSSEDFCMGLLDTERVLTYPGSEFGPIGEGFIRMTLLAPDPRFREAVERFTRFARGSRASRPKTARRDA